MFDHREEHQQQATIPLTFCPMPPIPSSAATTTTTSLSVDAGIAQSIIALSTFLVLKAGLHLFTVSARRRWAKEYKLQQQVQQLQERLTKVETDLLLFMRKVKREKSLPPPRPAVVIDLTGDSSSCSDSSDDDDDDDEDVDDLAVAGNQVDESKQEPPLLANHDDDDDGGDDGWMMDD